jgi:hypothetical protein
MKTLSTFLCILLAQVSYGQLTVWISAPSSVPSGQNYFVEAYSDAYPGNSEISILKNGSSFASAYTNYAGAYTTDYGAQTVEYLSRVT